MADEDKEKAEKLAAAKKRVREAHSKKGKKSGGKKKKDDTELATAADAEQAQEEQLREEGTARPGHAARKPSLSLQSKQRSESFRTGSGPLSPSNEVTELYQKQSQQISDLTAEKEFLTKEQEQHAAKLAKAEEELETLREQGGEIAELKSKAQEAESLKTEVESVKRQLAQAQKEAKESIKRRASGPSPDLKDELASKTSTIESLELEMSNLKNQVKTLGSNVDDKETKVTGLEGQLKTAEGERESLRQELEQLKVSMTFPSDDTKAVGEDPEALTKRITLLESDLRTANASLDTASERAKALESKLETLTKMHKDATTSSSAKDKELTDLRDQLRKRDKPNHVRDASDFDLHEDETETGALHARIRELEAENFDLKRGVWRDQRASMQPGMEDSPDNYEDVDLNGGPYSADRSRSRGSLPRQGSTIQDVINSGISAFTGRPRDAVGGQPAQGQRTMHDRKQSLGLLSEDDFDPEAWQQAQEEEAKRRVERVKEIKRGLEQWRGWRVDIVDTRKSAGSGFMNGVAGPVFEV
ncbi:hypothetical protein K431DRAFT_223038 [Polychaeton citri CBS 116435]|uniref:M protein repeat protein n=1 Tax=Polychaeton citri CBS 116435 TaxID=1314669 RepID=A0A9P4Q9A4_9PEZI|nr:hypothetical protein K431DRAFT_223038 [Polychaeton citri CBS 116435]